MDVKINYSAKYANGISQTHVSSSRRYCEVPPWKMKYVAYYWFVEDAIMYNAIMNIWTGLDGVMDRFKGDKNSVQKPRLNVVVIFPCIFLPPDVVNSKNMTSVVKKMFLCNLNDQITDIFTSP